MSLIENPWLHRHPSKRKFDEEEDDDVDMEEVSDLVSFRMRKGKAKLVNYCLGSTSYSTNNQASSSSSRSRRSRSQFQFFIRMYSGETKGMLAYPEETVESIHERIKTMNKIPIFEQRLIYKGKQLSYDQTLSECGIEKDANVQLVGRMRATKHPQACRDVEGIVSIVYCLCKGETVKDSGKNIEDFIDSYVKLAPKPDSNRTIVSEYFQIFRGSSAASLLVALYDSPLPGNKLSADASVRHFMTCCRNSMHKSLHNECALVVFEFCKLLRRLSCHDPLYRFCRSTLWFFLENSIFEHAGGLITDEEIFPFVRELASSLLNNLDLSMESPSLAAPLMDDVTDFTSFSTPLRSLYLAHFYRETLKKMDQCLEKMNQRMTGQEMGQGDKNFYPACSQYLPILKQLYKTYICKPCDRSAEEDFWCILMRQKSVLCLLIIRYAKREDEHQWLLQRRAVTNFESRRHLTMLMFPEIKEDYENLHEMLIDRSHLLTESFEYIVRADTTSLHAGLFMEFKNEEATGPGVLREWFFLVCQAIFNPQNALFVACPNDRRRFFPNPASKVHPLHLEYFSFSGRVIALALMHRVQVGIVFDRVFFFQLAGKHITLEDIRDADPVLYSSCKQILEMDSDFIDSDALGLTFVREVEELGQRKEVELCPGGKYIVVNSKNRAEYINLLIRDRFVTSISQQVSHFARGFADILSTSEHRKFFFQCLEPEDLDWMLCGSDDTISVEDWKAHTEYNGYVETDIQISWFWEILGRMTAEERKVLLFFWTSVKYLPVEGFCGLASRLYISKSHEPGDRLPSSHTCFYRLCFPAYSSKVVMENRLKVIAQEHIGCSFGTW